MFYYLFFEKQTLKQMLFVPLTMGSPSSSWSPGFVDLPKEMPVQRSLANSLTPWAPEQLGSIELSSSLSVATITSDSFVLFLGRYVYPLDSSTWIEYWPTDSRCPSCQRFLANLDEFTEDIFLNGCENAWRSAASSLHYGLLLLEFLLFFPQHSQLVLFGKFILLRMGDTCFY